MAVETSDNIRPIAILSENAGDAAAKAGDGGEIYPGERLLRRWLHRLSSIFPTHRIFTSLARRIFVANFLGLIILVSGILYISQDQAWLITAKRESLRIQGEIIAGAIAGKAKVTRSDGIILDPSKLPSVDDPRVPYREDAFAAMTLTISPHEVTPLLRRLIEPTNTRARIFAADYTLIADSNDMLTLSSMEDDESRLEKKPRNGRPEPKRSFWTKLNAWFLPDSTPVYREMTSDNISRFGEVRAAMTTGITVPLIFLNDKGQQIVSLVTPIKRLNAVQGLLVLSTRPGEIDEILDAERKVIWGVSALAVLATVIASMVLTSTISTPMRKLSAVAEHVKHNIKERTRLPRYPRRTDEVGKLAVAFHDMTAALYRRIEESEKFAADVAHELKNPLTAARGTAEAISYAKDNATRDHLVQQIGFELHRLDRLITDVADASRLNADLALQESIPVDLRIVLRGVTSTFAEMQDHETNNVKLVMADLPESANDFVVIGHEGRLEQVITNLIGNAVSFSPSQGLVRVSLQRIGPEVEIRVEDQGQGIPANKLETVFSRFYSDRPRTELKRGKNSGLGLSISREIVQAYDGRIWAENRGTPLPAQSRTDSAGQANRAGDGAVFIIRLPAAFPHHRHFGSLHGRWS